ncbi:MAG TPA: hypothetical protein VIG88_04835 [Lysobacter sp.]
MNFHVYERADGALLLLPTMLGPPTAGDLRALGRLDCDLSNFSAGLVTELGLRGRAVVLGPDRELLVERMGLAVPSPAGDDGLPVPGA